MKLRNGYTGDIKWSTILAQAAATFIIVAIVIAAIIGLYYWAKSSDYNIYLANNAKVAEFNELSLDQRIVIAEWTGHEVNEDYLMDFQPEPTSFAERIRIILPISILALLAITSWVCFASYDEAKCKGYFYADFPFNGKLSYVAFALMWASYPMMLGSYIKMQHWKTLQRNEQEGNTQSQQESRPNNETPLESTDDKYVTYEDLSADHTNFDSDSCEQYIKYHQGLSELNYNRRLNAATREVAKIESSLREYGYKVQAKQNELKTAKIELEQIKNSQPTEPKPTEVLTAEWEAIKDIRGVTNIYYNDYDIILYIDVAIRVPYNGEIYDFGDYEIKIRHNEIICPRIRSGVRDDWHGGYPDYCADNDNKFCLGGRRNKIEKYLSEHKIYEAVMLVIDCMHATNNEGEAKNIPACFRRIVSPKEG